MMTSPYHSFTAGLAILTISLSACIALADPPQKLPLLPPPDKTPDKAPEPPAKLPLPLPDKSPDKATKPKPNGPLLQVPVEITIAVPDIEKQLLRSLIEKFDPKAEPRLPIVLKSNGRGFAGGPEAGALEVANSVLLGVQQPGEPIPLMPQAGGPIPLMPPERPQLIPRPPGARPRLDRLAQRPLIAGVLNRVMGNAELAYRIELRSFKVAVSGNVLTCEVGGGLHTEAVVMQPPGMPPVPPLNIRDITIKLTVTKKLEWNENGKLELKEGTSQVWIDPTAPLIGFPRLDLERVVRLNGLLGMFNGVVDRELMKRISTENLPDLAAIAPTLKQKMPFLAISELTTYPIRGDNKNLYVDLGVSLVAANNKKDDVVKITNSPGPAPRPKVRGKVVFDKDGKPDVKLDPIQP